ncbi:hypothetical protein B1F79_02430 [Coxiella-like endosymbiont of Rhipicephalus sanguineus]|uniref:ATP-binding protein n=1 Tax=Coxiella-like endosymbiont of Rhipicephalus sanguineus TaxID=1955402 RepID=UPI00203F6927|nr:hypothetical protein [Coxiella-like endosymbiont of Rhipicephalus sanguineus]MBT8506480.1 hypothetical protein [Coxiella-like endosymbiont of Rhipicephalus sanguineus]
MPLVTNSNDFENALRSAQRELKSNFDNDTVFLEKYIKPARDLEVKIFLNQKGDGIYLFNRDCSIQRRYQKLLRKKLPHNFKKTTR